jgi:Zn-dependent peptidase ImmA (M78 family)
MTAPLLGQFQFGSLEALAHEIWGSSEFAERFPRPLQDAIALKIPLSVVPLPKVTTAAMRNWLFNGRMLAYLPADNRELMGCLVSHRGHGVAFICATDAPDEQRLTLAHETAHFLLDYLHPRREVIAKLGPEFLGILDGDRLATPSERAGAVMSHLSIGPYVHLFSRRGVDEEDDDALAATEARADALAVELLAPRCRVAEIISRWPEPRNAATMAATLADHFGVPAKVFEAQILAATRPMYSPILQAARAAMQARQNRELP